MTPKLLSSKEIGQLQNNLPAWSVSKKHIQRKFDFKNFIDAFGFITKVALLSETMNHHPEWSNTYGTVSIRLTSHDLGGLSDKDLLLANSIDLLI